MAKQVSILVIGQDILKTNGEVIFSAYSFDC